MKEGGWLAWLIFAFGNDNLEDFQRGQKATKQTNPDSMYSVSKNILAFTNEAINAKTEKSK